MQSDNYRYAVKALIRNKDNKYLLVKERIDKQKFWDLPGGGLEMNEDQITCLKRELYEELGFLEIIFSKSEPVEYSEIWTDYFVKSGIKRFGIKYAGQKNLLYLIDVSDSTINLNKDELVEFIWVVKQDLDKYLTNKNLLKAISEIANQ